MSSFLRNRGFGGQRQGRAVDPEERFQRWVTIGFVALIAGVVGIVLVALGFQYWEQHFKAVATVGGTGITRDDLSDRANLEYLRLERDKRQVRSALAAGEITKDDHDARLASLSSQQSNVGSIALERAIDLTYQGQLAAARGLTVDDAAVDAAIAEDETPPEKRRLRLVVIDPDPKGVGQPTTEERQTAFQKAQEAAAAIADGRPFTEVVGEYSTDEGTRGKDGDFGLVTRDSALDPAFREAVFALEKDGITPLMQGADGAYRIGQVTEIAPGTPDPAFESEIRKALSWDTYRRLVRQEALAHALEASVVAEATADQEQVRLAEIVLEGDTEADPADDSGRIHAAHILYSPDDDPTGAADLPEDDPAWTSAEQAAQEAAAELRAIDDVEERITRFAERAKEESDDTVSGADGGDLGFFDRGTMISEFADALFDAPELVRGDIVGPVKTDFGYHVIEFLERVPPLQERIDALTEQLGAEDADFAAIARAESDGPEGIAGGELGWRTKGQLDPKASSVVLGLEPDAVSEPVALDDGYHVYKLLEKSTRPLDALQLAVTRANAFDDWYDPQKDTAEGTKIISRDPSVSLQ
jgi:parvulin-like peptidyl-prolyl isomerase